MLAMSGRGREVRAGWLWRAGMPLLLSLLLAGCGASGAPESATVAITRAAGQAMTAVPEAESATPGANPIEVPDLATRPALQPTLPAMETPGADGFPITVSVPAGWVLREIAEGLIVLENGASLASAELECPVLLVRRIPGAANRADLLATFDLAGVLRQREIPLVIAGYPVDALDITVASAVTGRIYQVVLAPLMLKGEGLLFVASMPQGQAERAWPILASMLGSVALAGD